MKKLISIVLIVMLMLPGAMADEIQLRIQDMTDLGEIQSKLDEGMTIDKVYYTDGYGFSTSEFTTINAVEIESLWNAVNEITVLGKINMGITDWYPQIIFYLSDGTQGSVHFESTWLNVNGGRDNYELANADDFWSLTSSLVRKYSKRGEYAPTNGRDEPLDGGWGAVSDPTITDELKALFNKGMRDICGVEYTPVAYLGMQVVAGFNHAFLCQAKTIVPDASPRWVIVYMFESLENNVTLTEIKDLSW